MPKMKPPHYQGIRYAGRRVCEGEAIEVADLDVEAMEAAGWTLAGKATKAEEAAGDKPAAKKKGKR